MSKHDELHRQAMADAQAAGRSMDSIIAESEAEATMFKFTHDGKAHTAVGKNVDTDYGPELAVTISDDAGEVVGYSQECGSVELQVAWWVSAQKEMDKCMECDGHDCKRCPYEKE